MAKWIPDGSGMQQDGDVYGDFQAGEAYSLRYVNRDDKDAAEHALVTVDFYAEDLAYDRRQGFCVTRQTEYLLCTDIRDPGATESWRDYAYHELTEFGVHQTAEAADRAAKQAARKHSAADIDWDGQPHLPG